MLRCYILLLAISLGMHAWAQGCSDAGVCTAGPIGDLSTSNDSLITPIDHRHSARMTFSYAIGERGVTILQAVPQIDLGLGDRFGIQLKMPWISATGDLGSNSGVGDPVISTTYAFIKEDHQRMEAILGAKFPVNDANAMEDGKALPMPYQTSLGTTDLLLGLSYRWQRWQVALAYQHVLHHGNENEFTHARWMDDMRALGYFESPELRRADDAVARLQYRIPIGRLAVQPGVLAIFHVGKDEILEPAMDPIGNLRIPDHVSVAGSEGLTLNLTLDVQYKLSDQWAVLFAYGSPVITRDLRPDGLTRFMVANVALMHRFGR